jgi:ELWxxDGT repeat protein
MGHNGTHGFELWRSDGTAAGTYMVKDIRTGDNEEDVTDISQMTASNNAIYLNARNAAGDLSLFKSDGTREGTVQIHDSDRIFQFIAYKEHLLFVTSDGYRHKLWTTDGTASGTTLVEWFPVYSFWPRISHVEVDGTLYLGQQLSDEIWRTDGTECGSFAIDVGLKDVYNLTSIGSVLLFSALHHYYGNELFSLNVSNISQPSCPESLQATLVTSDDSINTGVMYNPNPFDGDFTLVVNSNLQSTAELAVYDMAGHPLMLDVLETNKPHQVGNNWKEGLYIMRITVDGKVMFKRVVKGGK